MKTFILTIFFVLAPTFGQAATRIVYFDQSALGSAHSGAGFTEDANGRCIIILSNPSTADQTFTIEIHATTQGVTTTAGTSGTMTADGSSSAMTFTAPDTLTHTNQPLLANRQKKYEVAFPTYTAGTSGQQHMFCRGKITVSDTASGTPGFIVASGIIMSFTESSIAQTLGTSSTAEYGGSAVYSQIPLTINGGKPF